MIVACIALFAALGGSALAATLAANSVTSKQVKNGSLKGKDLKANTITGTQVNEASLGQVPDAANATNATNATNANNAAQLGGAPPSAFRDTASSGYQAGICDPVSLTFTDCASTTLDLPHNGPVLLAGAGGAAGFASNAGGTCEFRVDGVLSTTPSVNPGESSFDNTNTTSQNGFSLTAVTESLAAGSHTFVLACNQRFNNAQFYDTTISAMLAG